MNFGGMLNLLSLDLGDLGGKRLFGSLFSEGSLIAIGVIAGVAVLAAIIIFLCKKKKG